MTGLGTCVLTAVLLFFNLQHCQVCIKVLKLHGRLDRSPALPVARRWEDIRVVRGLQFAIAVKEAGKPVNLSTPTRPPLTLHKATPPASRKLFW